MENSNYMHKETIQEFMKRMDSMLETQTKSIENIGSKVDSMQNDINELKIEVEKQKGFKSFFYSKEFLIVALLIIGAITGSNDLIKPLFGLLFGG